MDNYYAATASTLVQPTCHLHASLQPQALLVLLYDRYLSRHLAMELEIVPLMVE